MAMTEEQLRKQEEEFAAAYGEDEQKPDEQTEDAAFGIDPEPASEGDKEAVVVVADGEQLQEAAGEAAADETSKAETDAANAEAQNTGDNEVIDTAAAAPESPAVDVDKETQRLKSWEGRLKARAKELGMSLDEGGEVENAGSEALEEVADKAEAAGDTEKAAAAEQAADAVESGAMSFEQAIKALSEDFGDEFVKMIEAVAAKAAADAASKTADGKLGELGKTVEEIIAHIGDSQQRAHFEAIADAHPDFNDLKDSPEFKEFVKAYADGEKIANEGSARQVIKMLTAFKEGAKNAEQPAEKAAPTEAPVDTAAMDAAEGVRSGGLRLPEEPVESGDYAAAWSEA